MIYNQAITIIIVIFMAIIITSVNCSEPAQEFIGKGQNYFVQGQYDDAIAEYTKAIEQNPQCASAYAHRGIAYDSMGEISKAIDDFNKAIEIGPKYAEVELIRHLSAVYKKRGIANIVRGDYAIAKIRSGFTSYGADANTEYEKAIEDFTKAIDLDPKDAGAYYYRGVCYYKMNGNYSNAGEYDKSISDFAKAIELDPRNALAYNKRGASYYKKDEFDKAISDCTRAIELNANFAEAYSYRAEAYNEKDEYDKAISDITMAIKLNPKYAALECRSRGYIYEKYGERNKAEADFQKAPWSVFERLMVERLVLDD